MFSAESGEESVRRIGSTQFFCALLRADRGISVNEAAPHQGRYVEWLVEQSMLNDASAAAGQLATVGGMVQNPFGIPDPARAIEKAPVWFTAYPVSMVTKRGESFLETLCDDALWATFEILGIAAVHTGPVKRAGGISGWDVTPSVDGQFDRISTHIDEAFGTEQEFRRLCEVAAGHGGIVIDDIVPGHTGKGADFRLAEMNVGDYPGIYHMAEIPRQHWGLLPDVPTGQDSVNLGPETEERLEQAGYIIGRLQRVIFHDPGIKDTNWSVTGRVTGADGVQRRWVYLHYFKAGQPSINWLDPTFAGMRLVVGDALHSLNHLGAGALRLDANGFLGLEPAAGADEPAWSEGHPLSDAVNQLIASMVRKVGGFTFQELNLAIEDIKRTSEHGADLSYDYVSRPSYVHALTTGDTEFLRLTLNAALEQDLQPIGLVHGLQNHDEMTYELTHFAATHNSDRFRFRGVDRSGDELAHLIRSELVAGLTGPAAPYNQTFTTNGIASTLATICAAALGYTDLDQLSASADRVHHPGPPAARDVQRLAARGLGAVRLGPVRHPHDRPRANPGSGRDRRHPMDPSRRVRPDGLPAGRCRVGDRHAARSQPVRLTPTPARRSELVRLAAAPHTRRAPALRNRHRSAVGGARRLRSGPARDDPQASERAGPGDSAELLQPSHLRTGRVEALRNR